MGGDWYAPRLLYGRELKRLDIDATWKALTDSTIPTDDDLQTYLKFDEINEMLQDTHGLGCTIIRYVVEAYSRWEGSGPDEDCYQYMLGWEVSSFNNIPELQEWQDKHQTSQIDDAIKLICCKPYKNYSYTLGIVM